MRRDKQYNRVIFSPEVIKEAEKVLAKQCKVEKVYRSFELSLSSGEGWEYDNEEEFFEVYRNSKILKDALFRKNYYGCGLLMVKVYGEGSYFGIRTNLTVEMKTRQQIMSIFNIFDANVEKCRLPEKKVQKEVKRKVKRAVKEKKIFIGHGHDNQWRDLKDHLHEKHNIEVVAYEIGARAGLTVKEVLDEMLTTSSFALLVFTGEDEDAEGEMHARENVIHELGLFQGRLGWRKAVILIEDGVK